jgi:hypothetical protein
MHPLHCLWRQGVRVLDRCEENVFKTKFLNIFVQVIQKPGFMKSRLVLFSLLLLFDLVPFIAYAQVPTYMQKVYGAHLEPHVWFNGDSVSGFCPCFAYTSFSGTWKQLDQIKFQLEVHYDQDLSYNVQKTDTLSFVHDSISLLFRNKYGNPIIGEIKKLPYGKPYNEDDMAFLFNLDSNGNIKFHIDSLINTFIELKSPEHHNDFLRLKLHFRKSQINSVNLVVYIDDPSTRGNSMILLMNKLSDDCWIILDTSNNENFSLYCTHYQDDDYMFYEHQKSCPCLRFK